jgi:hypothetical protein
MKQLQFLVALLAFTLSSFAAPKITLRNNNNDWTSPSSWDLNRTPSNGDTVIIPSGFTAIVNANLNMSSTDLYVKVYGTLRFVGGGAKLVLGSNSVIHVFQNATITSTSSPSQLISIGGVSKYEGNDATVVGPVVADRTTGFGFASASFVTLPVQFLAFTATTQSNAALLQWTTTQEIDAAHFEVERSLDGGNWNKIATIKATGGEKVITHYNYSDRNIGASAAQYRIRQVDVNGQFTYTSVRSVKMGETIEPVKALASQGNVVLHFSDKVKSQVTVRIISMAGQVVSTTNLKQPAGQVLVPVSFKGQYIVAVSNSADINFSKQVLL